MDSKLANRVKIFFDCRLALTCMKLRVPSLSFLVPRVIFHLDMDAFFASVEQRDHPEYLGKPLIVGSPPDQRGVVCAASYEARKFQVRSAMPSRTAARLCPSGIFVRPRMDVYRAESSCIMEILHTFSPSVEKVSVDEAYLDMSSRCAESCGQDEALEWCMEIAVELKARILSERGLTASIGVASNKLLAKIGSDFNKPNGLTVIPESTKAEFLCPLSVRAVHGVGPVTARMLEEQGIHTIGDLQRTDVDLSCVAGFFAGKLRNLAFGNDDRPVDASDERKSISSETTFLVDTENRRELRGALKEMAEDLASTLAKHTLGALTIQVKVRYSDFTTLTRQIRLEEPVVNAPEIYRLACLILARQRLVTSPLRLLGVGVSTLVPPFTAQLRFPF